MMQENKLCPQGQVTYTDIINRLLDSRDDINSFLTILEKMEWVDEEQLGDVRELTNEIGCIVEGFDYMETNE